MKQNKDVHSDMKRAKGVEKQSKAMKTSLKSTSYIKLATGSYACVTHIHNFTKINSFPGRNKNMSAYPEKQNTLFNACVVSSITVPY